IPDTLTGQPAINAICRAMLPPVAPSGVAQPMRTSSTSPGSMPARSIAAWTTRPPIVAPWVMLRAPRQLFARPVRAVETITASRMANAPLAVTGRLAPAARSVVETLVLRGQFREQGRRRPEARVAMGIGREGFHRPQDIVETDLVRIQHRPAAEHRKAIAAQVDQVDVGSPHRDTLLEDVRSFVDQREDQPLDDLFVADPAWLHADFFAMRRNEFLDHRIGYRLAIAGLVAIPAGPGLLAEAADLAELVGNRRVLVVGL